MRIAQVSPLFESVPPKLYGGTERIVSYLTEELVRMGHDVTLFASGDSVTQAKLVPACARALRLDKSCIDQSAHHFVMLEQVYKSAGQFDIIHFHVDYVHFPVSRRMAVPQVTTLHGRLDIPDLVPLYHEYSDMPLVSISNDQRRPLPWVNWTGTVYHGLPADLHRLHKTHQNYLAFVGRISPEKRLDRAIEIAIRAGMELKIAAKVDKVDQAYFDEKIKPLLNGPNINYLGEINESEKDDVVGNALALIFPIDWPEPFGLVMIEAMATGTPVIAWRKGSVPEVIDPGETGVIVESIEESVEAIDQIRGLDRSLIRSIFEEKYSATRMARDYVNIYQRILRRNKKARTTGAEEYHAVF